MPLKQKQNRNNFGGTSFLPTRYKFFPTLLNSLTPKLMEIIGEHQSNSWRIKNKLGYQQKSTCLYNLGLNVRNLAQIILQ